MQLRPTDLPDPVVPATSRCGIGAMSAMTGSPEIFFPRISGRDMFWSSNAWLPISSLKRQPSRASALGSSMPITLRPGMVATRADSADMLRAMSSASWMTRLALIPLAGSSSYMVTTGPGRTSTMSPRTWKSSSTLSSRRALRSSPARSIWPLGFSGGGGEQVERRAAGNCRRARGWPGRAERPCPSSGWPWRPARSAWPDRRPRPPGASAAASRRRSSSSSAVLAAAAGPRRRAGDRGAARSAAHCFSSGRMPSASQPMTKPPSARIAISASRSGPSIDGIADQLDRRHRRHRHRPGPSAPP